MDTKLEQFLDAYQKADENVKKLIDDGKVGLFVEQLLTKLGTNNSTKPKLIILISNALLHVINTDELKHTLNQLSFSAKEIELITGEVISFIAAPYTHLHQGVFKEDVRQTDTSHQQQQPLQTLEEQPATSEHTAVSPLRTMAGDMERIHGYGAFNKALAEDGGQNEETVVQATSQDDVLTKNNTKPATE